MHVAVMPAQMDRQIAGLAAGRGHFDIQNASGVKQPVGDTNFGPCIEEPAEVLLGTKPLKQWKHGWMLGPFDQLVAYGRWNLATESTKQTMGIGHASPSDA